MNTITFVTSNIQKLNEVSAILSKQNTSFDSSTPCSRIARVTS